MEQHLTMHARPLKGDRHLFSSENEEFQVVSGEKKMPVPIFGAAHVRGRRPLKRWSLDCRGIMKKVLPPTYFLAAIVLALILHFMVPVHQLLSFPWRFLGLAPLVVGIVLNLLADQTFKKHDTTVKPFEESNALVIGGVFNISRNPMYLGMTLILLGIALLLGSATPFGVVIILAVLFDHVFIVPEERMLEETFGDQFRQYRNRVRKWI